MYDRKLIQGLIRGDKESYREFIDSNYSLYLSFACAVVNDREAAKDILQNVLLKLYLHRKEIDADKNLHAFLLKAIRLEALNYLRLSFNSQKGGPITEGISSKDPYSGLYYDEMFSKIGTIVKEMPPMRRRVFTMSRFGGKSNREIAEILGISARTVEKHIELALKSIREAL